MSDNEDLEDLVESDEIDIPFDVEDEVKKEEKVEADTNGRINIGKEKFTSLHTVLQILSSTDKTTKEGICEDADIRDGIIRQFNNTKSMILCIDLRPILGNINLKMSGIKQKYEMLEPFKKQSVDVVAEFNDMTYAFMDNISRLSFHQGITEYIQNPYISETSFNTKIPQGRKVFEKVLDKKILDRLSSYSKSLKSEIIKVKFNKTKAHFELTASDGASPSIASLLSIEDELEETNIVGSTTIPVSPFVFCLEGGISELTMEYFHQDKKEGDYLVKISGKLPIGGSDDIIPIVIWMRSLLRNV